MTPVEISEAADTDLTDIFDYGADHFGDDAAAAYLRSFDDAFALISDHPLIGAIPDNVRPPIHSLPHGGHRIYYYIVENRVIVRRILHKAGDVEQHL